MERQIVTIKIPAELVVKIEKAAAKENRTRSNWIETKLKEALKGK